MLCFRSMFAFILASALALPAACADPARANPSGAPMMLAQNFQPPGAIPDAGGYGAPQASDSAALLLRIDRLEDQVRSLNGQIETLQFNEKRLEDALRKFQGDVDFRFQDVEHAKPAGRAIGKRSDAAGSLPSEDPAYPVAANPPADSNENPDATPRARRNDAFDPEAHPDAPGSPRSLGSLTQNSAGADDADAAGAPLQLDNGPAPPPNESAPAAPAGPLADASRPSTAPHDRTTFAGLAAATPREDFDLALVSYNNGQFSEAQSAFREFLDHHPRDRLTPEATYYLGESYWRLGRMREAAEQYLKVSTDFAKSPRAPESLLKLGLSLEKLGSRDQACASWAQIGRKYPTAAAAVRASADRNMKRDQC